MIKPGDYSLNRSSVFDMLLLWMFFWTSFTAQKVDDPLKLEKKDEKLSQISIKG